MFNVALRAFLALLLAGTFGLGVSASGMMWDCAAAAGHSPRSGHAHDGGHDSQPAPTEHSSGCECVGQSCSTTAVLSAAELTLARPSHTSVPVLASAANSLPRPGIEHLLPFANAPPPPSPSFA